MKVKCAFCGKEFEQRRSDQRYCSPRCRNIINLRRTYARQHPKPTKKPRVCPVCGKELPPDSRWNTVYCSVRCRNHGNRLAYLEKLRAVGKTRPSRAKVREPRACEFCGQMFVPKQDNSKFCSKKCSSAEYFRRNREELREKERAYRATHPRKGSHHGHPPAAAAQIQFVQKRETPERDSVARVMAYLSLPDAERWARRSTLTKKELIMARDMWMRIKCAPPIYQRTYL